MATKFEAGYMINSATTAGENFLSGGWDFIARAAYLIHDAHDKKTADTRKRTLEIRLMKSGEHSPATITEYLRKAQVVADFWRFEDVVPTNAAGAYVSVVENGDGTKSENPLGFVEMLNYGAETAPEDWAKGSIIQRIRVLWCTLNDIKRAGPPSERKASAPKAKAEATAKAETVSEPVAEATSEATAEATSGADFLSLSIEDMARAILEGDALETVRAAVMAADAMRAEMALKVA